MIILMIKIQRIDNCERLKLWRLFMFLLCLLLLLDVSLKDGLFFSLENWKHACADFIVPFLLNRLTFKILNSVSFRQIWISQRLLKWLWML